MAAAGLAEALHQHAVVGVEIDDLAVDAAVAQALDQGGHPLQVAHRAARVDAERRASGQWRRAVGHLAGKGLEQARREVVDAVETAVLEGLERDALARARQAGHQHDAVRFGACHASLPALTLAHRAVAGQAAGRIA